MRQRGCQLKLTFSQDQYFLKVRKIYFFCLCPESMVLNGLLHQTTLYLVVLSGVHIYSRGFLELAQSKEQTLVVLDSQLKKETWLRN